MKPLQNKSAADERGIHKPPQEWFEMARVFQTEIYHHVCRHGVDVEVFPAYKGGRKHGYFWAGNYRLEFMPWTYGMSTQPNIYKRYCKGRSIERVRRIWDNIEAKVRTEARGFELVAIYRKSGLIPPHIAKAHAARLKKDFPKLDYYHDPALQARLHMMLTFYLRHYAECPKCKSKGFEECLLGWMCENCRYTLEDVGRELTWYQQ